MFCCDWAALRTARLTRVLARQGERQKPSVSISTLGTNAPPSSPVRDDRRGREKKLASGSPILRFLQSIRLNLNAIWNNVLSLV